MTPINLEMLMSLPSNRRLWDEAVVKRAVFSQNK